MKEKAMFEIVCEGQSIKDRLKDGNTSEQYRAGVAFGFPRWLKVAPATGVIKLGQIAEISFHHEEMHTLNDIMDGVSQTWLAEDARDKEVILLVKVTGNASSDIRNLRVHVRHSFSPNTTTRTDSRSNSKRALSNCSQNSEYRHHGSSNDGFDGICNFRIPRRECLIDILISESGGDFCASAYFILNLTTSCTHLLVNTPWSCAQLIFRIFRSK